MRSGDEEARNLFYEKFQDRLKATCIHFLGYQDPECEDLVQETYVLAFKNLEQCDLRGGLYGWLNKICVNLCFRRLKLRQRQVVTAAEELEAVAEAEASARFHEQEHLSLKREALGLVEKAFKLLGERCKEVIRLRDFEGRSYIEIAKTLKLAPGTLFSRLARCRTALKQLVRDAAPRGRGPSHG